MSVKAFVEKRKWAIIISFCLFLNLAIATTIRVRNLPLLEGTYLLETDAYRFLRQAKIIVEQGTLPERDMMRYVPPSCSFQPSQSNKPRFSTRFSVSWRV